MIHFTYLTLKKENFSKTLFRQCHEFTLSGDYYMRRKIYLIYLISLFDYIKVLKREYVV